MTRYIGISFTLKGQDIKQIIPALETIAKSYPETDKVVLLHGFMPLAEVLEKKFDTALVDALDHYFPEQLHFYQHGKPDRAAMVKFASEAQAEVYFIGEIKEGVEEEYNLYLQGLEPPFNGQAVKIHKIELDAPTVIIQDWKEKTFTKADMVAFGTYLLSDSRVEHLDEPSKLMIVTMEDVKNFLKTS